MTPATASEEGPETSSLSVYPNPSVGGSVVTLTLAEAAEVRIEVDNVLRREAALLHDGPLSAGERHPPLDAAALAAGTYFVRTTGTGEPAVASVTVTR